MSEEKKTHPSTNIPLLSLRKSEQEIYIFKRDEEFELMRYVELQYVKKTARISGVALNVPSMSLNLYLIVFGKRKY